MQKLNVNRADETYPTLSRRSIPSALVVILMLAYSGCTGGLSAIGPDGSIQPGPTPSPTPYQEAEVEAGTGDLLGPILSSGLDLASGEITGPEVEISE